MAKRKRKKNKKNNFLKYATWGSAIMAISLSLLVGGYYIGHEDARTNTQKIKQIHNKKRQTGVEETGSHKIKKSANPKLKKVLKKEPKVELGGAAHEYENENLPDALRRNPKRISSKPKLAIIIDDVGVNSQVKAIKSIGIPLTMSFLPPNKFHPNSAKLASREDFYMVHLPMEAKHYTAEETNTMRVADSQEKIAKRIQTIKKEFPKVSYINNHTGSRFTSNELAMNRLLYVMKKQHINFIDSRTTAETKAPEVMKNLGLNYVARDVFLDNSADKDSIKIQIKRAIKVAKNHGTAIAIGHPHKNTLEAIKESKKLFKEVELVYIYELY